MVKNIFIILALVFALVAPPVAQARDYHAFAAFGIAYGLGSVRVGSGDWEGGLLTNKMIGFNKIFDLSGSPYYSTFGLGISNSVGFYAGMGFHKKLWIFHTRGELAATSDLSGNSGATGLLGLTYGF